MEEPPPQPDYEPAIQSFLSFLDRVSSFEVVNPDPPEGPIRLGFVPLDKVKAYLQDNGQEKLNQIIAALFPRGDGIYPNDVLPDNIAVFCTLLKISKGAWIKYFRHHRSLRDAALHFDPASQPLNWPEDTGDPEFLKKFCEQQWKFCVPVMRQPFVDQHFPKDLILPIIYKTALGSGGSATLWKIKLHPDYNNLITEEEKARLKDSANTFVLKIYFATEAAKYYNREVDAFRRLQQHGPHSGIIGFHGSFTRGDTHNVLLEYADKGTLEKYFLTQIPPVHPEQIINFWQALFKLLDALSRIHEVDRTTGGPLIIHGWHQDVKPENILVISNGSENPHDWEFKLADLGTSHFKRVDASRQDSTASDSYGTRTYGAPECYRPDESSFNDKLRVGQNVDVWSLGCVYSEAARWFSYQRPGLFQYRRERSEEISSIPEFQDADCFHNGREVLNTVRESHQMSTANLRTGDCITKAVVEQMIREMLYDAEARPTAVKLWHKSKEIVKEARRELQRIETSRSPEHGPSRSTSNRSRTIPEQRPPAPPHPPPDVVPDFGRLYQREIRTPSSPTGGRRPAHGHINSYRMATTSSILPYEEGRHSPESIPERWDRELTGLTEYSPARPTPSSRIHQIRTSDHSGYNHRGGISPREASRQQTQSSVYGGSQSDTFGIGIPWEHDHINMNGRSPRGARNRNSDHSQGYCPSPALDRPSSGATRRSESPENMEEVEFTPNTHSRQISQGESSHSRMGSDNSALPVVRSAVSPPTQVRTSAPIPPSDTPAPTLAAHHIASTPPRPITQSPRWSVEEALKWRMERKNNGSQKETPNPQLHARLLKRDHAFLVDDAATMAPYWDRLTQVFKALSYILKYADPNRLDLSFTVCREALTKAKTTTPLVDLVKSRRGHLEGTTDMNLRLTEILEAYQTELEHPKKSFSSIYTRKPILTRPLNIYILTDGIWEPNCDASGPIKSLVNKLNQLGKGRIQVGIQFISFGDNQRALERLNVLDSGLGLKPDIVDHERSDGDVWKMLLGSTNDTYDKINENQQSNTSTTMTGNSSMTDKECA